MRLLTIAVIAAAVAGCAPSNPSPKALAQKAQWDAEADKCWANGKLRRTESIKADGIFVDDRYMPFPWELAARLLGEQRMTFVEFRRRPATGGRWADYFAESLIGPERNEPYVRLSVSSNDDPRCASFKKIFPYSGLGKTATRWVGISPDVCIALERVHELGAPIELAYEREQPQSSETAMGWYTLRNRSNGEVYERVWSDEDRWCKNRKETDGMLRLVHGNGSALLPPLPEVERVEKVAFPIHSKARLGSLGPEVPEHTKTPEWERRYSLYSATYENVDVYGLSADNAQTWIASYHRAYSTGRLQGFHLAGYDLVLVRPGVRKMVRIADGSLQFTWCTRIRREGLLLVVECSSYRDAANEHLPLVHDQWLLSFQSDGTPHRAFAIEVPPDGRQTSFFGIESKDGVPHHALIEKRRSAGNGRIERSWHRAEIEVEE